MRCVNIILFFLLTFINSTTLISQNQSIDPFYIEDFIFDDDAYRILGFKEGNKILRFEISLKNISTQFDLVNLNNQLVLHKKLSEGIQIIRKSIDFDYIGKSKSLNSKLRLIKASGDSDSTYVIPQDLKQETIGIINNLIAIKGCDSVFVNRPIFTYLKDSIRNLSIRSFTGSLQTSCKLVRLKIEDSLNNDLMKVTIDLQKKMIKALLTEKDNASLAGKIVVLRDTINPLINVSKKSQETLSSTFNESYENKEDPGYKVFSDLEKKHENTPDSLLEELKKRGDDGTLFLPYVIDSVQFEFEGDKLLNVKVIGKIDKEIIIFENVYPISFSTKLDVNKGFSLFSIKNNSYDKMRIESSQVFYYDYNFLLNTENYAPKNQIVYVKPGAEGKILFKEKNEEILKAKVFSDLVGLNDDNPNGILQIEVSKPVNLWTKVFPMGKFSTSYLTIFSEIEPIFAWNKIEDDDKELKVLKVNDLSFASYNDIMRFRTASIGGNLQLIQLGIPSFHSKFSIGYNHNYSFVPLLVQDTISQIVQDPNIQINNLEENSSTYLTRDLGGYVKWDILPSDKYQFHFVYNLRWFRFFSNDNNDPVFPFTNQEKILSMSGNEEITSDRNKNELFHSFEFFATIRLSKRRVVF